MYSATRLRIFKLVALVVAFAGSLFVIEAGVRIKDRALFEFRDLRPEPWGFSPRGFAEFDPELGWWRAEGRLVGVRRREPVSQERFCFGLDGLARSHASRARELFGVRR
jgi:hypothetical protein